MKTVRLATAAVVVTFLAMMAASSPAQAYEGVDVTVTDRTVVGGEDVSITATVDPPVNCDWELTYNGQTATGSGSSITATFETEEVDEVTDTTAFATCNFDDTELLTSSSSFGGGGAHGTLGTLVQAPQSSSGTGTITLLPEGDDDDDDGDGDGDGDGDDDKGGALPNTGGERLTWLGIGGALMLAGGGALVASRRRNA